MAMIYIEPIKRFAAFSIRRRTGKDIFMKTITLILATLAGLTVATATETYAQAAPEITGRVTDAAGQPVKDVDVLLLEIRRATVTDSDGIYTFTRLPRGTYTVTFSILGYAPVIRRMTVGAGDNTLNVALASSPVEVPGIQVTASASATSALESPQPTTVLSDEDLDAAQAPSLGETLDHVPGVHNLSTGIGIGKPVIRGLTSNRVLVLENGQRLETQQWGDEHGPDVETINAERIEVIRGPASVLYGSDALGGVVNIIPPDVPDALGRDAFIQGSFTGGYASNNQQPEGDLSIEGASGGLGFRVSGTGRSSENLETPDYELWNSGNRAVGGGAALGYRGAWGSLNGRYVYRDERIELTDEDPAETPFQRIGDHRAEFELIAPFGESRLEATVGFERNRRREFEESGATDVALGLLSRTYTGEIHLHHPILGPFFGLLGLSGMHTSFEKFGEETLIPENTSNAVGVYAFEQAEAGRWSFSMGGRYDFRHLDVEDDEELGLTAQTKSWNSLTGNIGVLYRVSEPMALVLNVGRGFRAPSAFELYSNGVHEGTIAFERGNPDLDTEKSLNIDLAARVFAHRMIGELGGFVNRVQDFIFTLPTGDVDPESGFEIFDVVQGDAVLSGIESSLELHPTDVLHLEAAVDYVYGENTSSDEPLPNVPPLRATYKLRYEGKSGDVFENPNLWIGGESNARQARLNPADAEFFTGAFDGEGYMSEAYTLINAGGGFEISLGPRRSVHVDMQIRNLFDESYAPFLSRIKTNAMNPGQGRNLILRLTTEF
ncbi:MAG TPA: TonB-dependent receptor [Gemmatimonadota bacterium]|jgi:iron complex outermembrane receptor protein